MFILDLGLKIYQVRYLEPGKCLYNWILQWNGKTANKDERFKALQYVQKLKSERSGRPETETISELSMKGLLI